jgi:hypothetical protein
MRPDPSALYRGFCLLPVSSDSGTEGPGLNTHEFTSKKCPHDDKLFESYAENNTPAAYRVFWCYNPPPPKDVILVVAITPHP